jgi:hypothetical protein
MTIVLALVVARSKTGMGIYSKVEKEKRKAKREGRVPEEVLEDEDKDSKEE